MVTARPIIVTALGALLSGWLAATGAASMLVKKPPAAATTTKARAKGTTTAKAKTPARPATTSVAVRTSLPSKPATSTGTKSTAPAATTAPSASTIPTLVGPKIDDMPGDDPKVDLPDGDRTIERETFPVESWGTATVTIVVTGGKIVAVSADLPWHTSRSKVINSRVGPYLNEQAIELQAARLNLISGATYTTGAYYKSLQSAIDRAQLAKGSLAPAG